MKQTLIILCITLSVYVYGQSLLIKNVNLIDVKSGKVIPATSVLVTGSIITEIGPSSKLKTSNQTQVIDGTGQYLLPGMIDAHIHFFQSGGLYTRPDALDLQFKMPYEKEREFGFNNAADYLKRYVRLGITTVIDVGGPFQNFIIRDSIAKSFPAPNVLVTGPLFSMVDRKKLELNDPPIVKISTPDQADSLFQKMLPYKPDFIKIWYIANRNLPAEKSFPLVRHIAELAHRNNLKLTVHATQLQTAQLAVEAGADILVHSIDDEVIPDAFIKMLKDKKVAYTPTLIVGKNYYKVFSGRLDHHPQDLKWANAFAYATLQDPEGYSDTEMPALLKNLRASGIPPAENKSDSIMALNLRKLIKAGVNVIVGTDAGNIGTLHASSHLQELEAMSKAGLTNQEILRAATWQTALGFGKEKTLGSIEKGKQADMILLTKNPLETLGNLNSITYTIVRGVAVLAEANLTESPEAVVQRQVNAYNARNIDAFLDTYADEVELINWNGQLLSRGKDQMRTIYADLFSRTPNLYCKIENRIVAGNKIIDKEHVRFGNDFVDAVAVYEVENGKIRKVTFIR
jgi:imidazolonepropionase-like amidohydrolase